MPRPSKFTEPVKQQILGVLKVGASRRTAAAVVGINDDTLRVWLKRGEELDDDDSPWTRFYREVVAAEAELPFKALGVVSREIENRPDLAWKVVERREPGYAPPTPGSHHVAPAVQINLSLTGSQAPLPAWIEGEVVDAQESPALGDGGGDTADPAEADSP